MTFLRPHGRWLDLHSSEMKLLSRVGLLVIPWTVAFQAPPSMEFSRQGYWSGLPFPSLADLPCLGIKPKSPTLEVDALPLSHQRSPTFKWSEVAQSCPTLRDPMDCSLPGSSIHEIFQARVLVWVAISFSRGSVQPRDQTWVSHIVGRCFTIWAMREVLHSSRDWLNQKPSSHTLLSSFTLRAEPVNQWSCSVMSNSLRPQGL